jgi:molecular chaperone DnaK (HSP70)
MKLFLSPLFLENMNSTDEAIVDVTRKQLRQLKKSALDVISDYLRFFWDHILERLRARLTTVVLDNMVLKVVLTIPAIWDHSAHEKMRNAAERAGITKYRPCGLTELSSFAEPAAAALSTYFDAGLQLSSIFDVRS